MNTTRSGEVVSAQIGIMGKIELQDSNFYLADGQPFNVKNDGDESISLEIKLAGMEDFIETTFEPGWNPEIVREIKKTSLENLNLKWGY